MVARGLLSQQLKIWFIIHFFLDVAAAIPLMCFPVQSLALLNWQSFDPFATRLVAAALFGIGIESWLGRNSSLATFSHMLNLKIIWSATAVVGIAWSMFQVLGGPVPSQWAAFAIFLAFHILWVRFRLKVRGQQNS